MRALPLALLVSLIFIACDDDAGTSVTNTGRDAAMVPIQPDAGMAPTMPTPDMMATQPQPMPTKNALQIQGDVNITMVFGEMRMVSVKYVDSQQMPIANSRITLTNLSQQMLVTATPGSMSTTDAQGIATFTLTANEVAGNVMLTAEAVNADAVSWNVTVSKRPTGTVSVRAIYSEQTGRYRISDIKTVRVKLIDGPCDEAFRIVANRREFPAPRVIMPFTGTDIVDIPDVPTTGTFSAVAEGLNANGFPFVRGCTAGVQADAATVNTADVNMGDMPLEFKGIFNVEHEMNLTCVLAGSNDGELQTFLRILRLLAIFGSGEGEGMYPLTSALVEYICDIGGDELGFDVPGPICDLAGGIGGMLAGAAFEPQIEGFLDGLPMELRTILTGIGDLWRNINRFKVQGQMEFTQSFPDAEGFLRNNETRWNTFSFVWSQDENGAACPFDSPEECRRPLALADNNGRATPFKGTFTALKVEGKDSLLIARHPVAINFGQLFLVALKQWYLPNQFDKACMVDADCWAGAVCDAANNRCLAQDGQGVPLSELFAQILPCGAIDGLLGAGQCAMTVAPLAANIFEQQLINSTAGTAALTLAGTVDFADTYPNLKADWLYNGQWDGQFGDDSEIVRGMGVYSGIRASEMMQAEMNPPEGQMMNLAPVNCGE